MAKKKSPKSKRSRPKGKKLSEKLREKDEAKVADAEAEDDGDDDELASEPPPSPDFDDDDAPAPADDDDDDVVDAQYDDEDEDEGDDDEPPPSDTGYDDDDDDDDEWDDEDEDAAATHMGHQRYIFAGFFALWMIVGFLCGATVELLWGMWGADDRFIEYFPTLAAIPHDGELVSRASISLVLGAVIGALIVIRYYLKPDIRQWADEVAEQLAQVKWPNRKEVGNNTVVVMIATAVITAYLSLLDRFWDFVTTMIYTSGT